MPDEVKDAIRDARLDNNKSTLLLIARQFTVAAKLDAIATLIAPRPWRARMTALWNEGTPAERAAWRSTI